MKLCSSPFASPAPKISRSYNESSPIFAHNLRFLPLKSYSAATNNPIHSRFSRSLVTTMALPPPPTCHPASTTTTTPTTTTPTLSLQDTSLVLNLPSTTIPLIKSIPSINELSSQPAPDGHYNKNNNNQGLLLSATTPDGTPTHSLDLCLGSFLSPTVDRFMALGRTSLWWMTPAWGSGSDPIPGETQFLLLRCHHRQSSNDDDDDAYVYVLILPLLCHGGAFRATLHSGESRSSQKQKEQQNDVYLRIESGASDVTSDYFSNALYITSTTSTNNKESAYDLIARGVAFAASLAGTARPRSQKTTPPIVDRFLWCTWDAFYSSVSASGVAAGVASLRQGGTPARGVIIDDGWQMTDVDRQYRDGTGSVLDAVQHDTVVEEATAELLGGAGDQGAEALKGQHEQERLPSSSDGTTTTTKTSKTKSSVATVLKSIVSWIEATLLHWGKHLMDASPPDSLLIRTFSRLVTGPLRPSLLRFYAHATDHTRRLTDIRANGKFASITSDAASGLASSGSNLASVVAALKRDHGVEFVYAWHAMGGFWGGLGVDDLGVLKYNATLLTPIPTQGILAQDPAVAWVQPVVAGVNIPLDPTALHDDMHAYLASCGVDGVKVDVQGTIGLAGSVGGALGGGPALAATYHASLEASAARHFPGNHLINCMCHSTEDLYHMKDTNLARCSDDFYPRRPPSHTAHIANCAYNSVFMGELVICDFDMFHSKHEKAELHAAARAISGGPVYVSDAPGSHDFSVLKRLVLRDGSTLRALLPGRPTVDCLFADVSHDGTTALKMWNKNALNGVVGVFNVQGSAFSRRHRAFRTHDTRPPSLKSMVRPTDVEAFVVSGGTSTHDDAYVLYSDRTQQLLYVNINSRAEQHKQQKEWGMEVEVGPHGGFDLITVAPVLTLPMLCVRHQEEQEVEFAAIGLVNMMNSGGAVGECKEHETEEATVVLRIRGEGRFLAYASHRPSKIVAYDAHDSGSGGSVKVDFEYEEETKVVRFEVGVEDECHVSVPRVYTILFV